MVEKRKPWTLDREWGTALSLIVHLVLATVWLLMPKNFLQKPRPADEKQPDPMGLVKLFEAAEPKPPIPVQFYPAPGTPKEAAPKRFLPSDANRKAGGGDPQLPKAETPKSVAKQGIQDLAEGRKSEKMAADPRADAGDKQKATYPATQREAAVASAESLIRRGLTGIPSSPLAGLTAEEAARAARAGDQGGDGGAGFNSEGGFVDNGPLSFDTKDYDFSSYAAEMIRKIKRNWEIPGLAHYGVKGYLILKFFIRRDGSVEDVRILQSSGVPPFDNAAVMAIRNSNPFKPLPQDLHVDREGVSIGFFYNLRPEDVPSWNRR